MRTTALFLTLAILVAPMTFAAEDGDEDADKGSRLFQALGYATFAGSAGDLLSTQYGIANGRTELNPFQQHVGARVATTVAFPFVANYLTEELRKDGHPKLALWLRVAVIGLKGYAIAHNLRGAR
jgi:hypothetical protein